VERTPKVLFIEDDAATRRALTRELREAGFSIDEAGTGAAGLAALSPDHDVVIVDTALPDMPGGAIAAKVKGTPETTTVMVIELSATSATAQQRAESLARGADAYLVHPIEVVELVAVMRALIRLRHAEQERERHRELFLGAVGHDLRNPLGVMVTGIEMLMASPDLSERDRSTVRRLQRSSERMVRLLDQLLTFSQGVAGGVPIAATPAGLGELVREAVRDLDLRGRDLSIDDKFSGMVVLDRRRIGQLVENLVTNALRHGEGPISIYLAREPDWALLSFHNAGKPIPPEALPALFDPYRRATARAHGFGLGLFIVDQIVRAHRGTVTVRSTAEAGTTFEIRLPLG
jgi:signal transduction histidine kinase